MLCFKEGEKFALKETKKEEISSELEKEINELCSKWQVRDLRQQNASSLYGYDEDYDSIKKYEPLDPENMVVSNNKVVGYFANHFNIAKYVEFPPAEEKIRLGDYDYSDYSNGTNKIDRGHVAIVSRPDNDNNPYHDEPRFHSQEEYDDYIKWRD